MKLLLYDYNLDEKFKLLTVYFRYVISADSSELLEYIYKFQVPFQIYLNNVLVSNIFSFIRYLNTGFNLEK